jgi:hypothetical protein
MIVRPFCVIEPLSPEQREKRRAYLKAWHEVHREERHAYYKIGNTFMPEATTGPTPESRERRRC